MLNIAQPMWISSFLAVLRNWSVEHKTKQEKSCNDFSVDYSDNLIRDHFLIALIPITTCFLYGVIFVRFMYVCL